MGRVELEHISVRYGSNLAVQDASFSCSDGALTCLLGASGAGKTTILNAIAGIVDIESGIICVDEQDLAGSPPQKRNFAMTFEGYNLYPHINVRENLAFPLRSPMRKGSYGEHDIQARVQEIATMLQIETLLDRYPREISGGQKQRVALGRMLVREHPVAYLLDEPIAHLDAKLRHQMVGELKRIHTEIGTTMVYATPDAEEAIALADKIIFLDSGVIVQTGAPRDFIEQPANLKIARFIGEPEINSIECTAAEYRIRSIDNVDVLIDRHAIARLYESSALNEQESFHLAIRPHYCSFFEQRPSDNYIDSQVTVGSVERRGDSFVATLHSGDRSYRVKEKYFGRTPAVGSTGWIGLDPDHMHLFERNGDNLQGHEH